MRHRAPRQTWGLGRHCARGAWLAVCSWLALLVPGAVIAQQIESARYIGPTTHYAHGVLGDAVEYTGMMVRLSDGTPYLTGFSPGTRVFEDVAPRLWDVTGDTAPEIVVIETDPPQGAQLAIYGLRNGAVTKIAATPLIGRTNRWLAPVGAADLDGDGYIEIAYIDRPHLAKRLRIWRYVNGALTHVADRDGLTNHRIGWDFIAGGVRDCGKGPEMIMASADWTRVVAARFDGTSIQTRDIGAWIGPQSAKQAMTC